MNEIYDIMPDPVIIHPRFVDESFLLHSRESDCGGIRRTVDHPDHYGGKDNPYEAIKVIHAWQLGFDLGNTIKYISRAGKKEGSTELEDLRKALWYLQHRINLLSSSLSVT